MNKSLRYKNIIVLFLFFIVALSLRLYGLNWDQGTHLHPDERFLTMVTTDIKLPNSIFQYFNPKDSPLNPYNYPNYQFFVYGTFPIFLVKAVGVILHMDNYEKIVLVGRALSAVFDSFNVVLLYFIAKKLKISKKITFLPSLLYAFCVLPLQLSHFYAVDTFLNSFLLATFVLLTYNFYFFAAAAFGLAMACKISALYFVPIIGLFFIKELLRKRPILHLIGILILSIIISFITFRSFQPYIFDGFFKISTHFMENIDTLKSFSNRNVGFPPSVQWLNISPLLFTFKNITIWGMGLPLFFAFILAFIQNPKKYLTNYVSLLSLIWVLFLFFYQGSQFNPTMRYFLPIYPFAITIFVFALSYHNKQKIFIGFIILHILYGLSFLTIYSHNHTRVDGSLWIYQNLPKGSVITNEYWDDPLPLNIDPHNSNVFKGVMLSPYDPDTPEKIQTLVATTSSSDFIIMSSNRLWRSIPSAPELYPLTTQYYNNIFANNSQYLKLYEGNSYPGFRIPVLTACYYFGLTNYPGVTNSWFEKDSGCKYPGIYLRDDTSEEAFTVYDHPKVLIYRRLK